MVRGSFVRVCPAVVQCVRVLQITSEIMVHLWFGLGSGWFGVGSLVVRGWFAGGSCESALQFRERAPLLQIKRKIAVHQWFGLGSGLVRGWVLRICSAALRVHAFVAIHQENRGSLVAPSLFTPGSCCGSCLVRCWFAGSLLVPLLGAAVFADFSDFLAAGCNIGFQVLRPGLVLLRLAQGWSLEAVCRAVPFRFSSMSRCDSLPPREPKSWAWGSCFA